MFILYVFIYRKNIEYGFKICHLTFLFQGKILNAFDNLSDYYSFPYEIKTYFDKDYKCEKIEKTFQNESAP